ncbi:LuxR C-terminal-related transcriptional regulator [Mycolicibacterium sp. BiH015]|uniref:LuxR C-terminal-related transcriptional regulator n=1 Tax=Mycolicibacterium sp. BiH015 TaxID=3018808 RepID=UPI0022E61225|nr:LuxR family transcriptional regulator [Mycolicibacterium sp. BiH015]MDA2890259.1 LuxR C-terminal-related transcriptional regulator [Mycolicibacterium sp. BiH015]
MRLSWPLIGRSGELRAVEAALSAPDADGVVVFGSAGIGKSRIARAVLSAAASRGCHAHLVVGTSSARAIPLGAFAAWAPPGVTEPVHLLRGVIDSLTASPANDPVVLGVDDAHLLDDLSTFVVQQIVQRSAAKVILTVPDREPIPTAVQEIWRTGQLDRIDLKPLPLADTSVLLSKTLGAPVDADAVQRLWSLTLGNILYLRTIVEQVLADGHFENVNGRWRWTGDPVIPPGLVELVQSRIGSLPAPVGHVVDVLAVGEPIELATLRQIADPEAIEEAEIRGLISLHTTTTGVDVRNAHPLYSEVRRKRAPATTLRRLRGQVATALTSSGTGGDIHVLVRRASLTLDSDLDPDTDLLTRAAHGAVWLADLTLAERLAGAASRFGAGLEADFLRAHALSWLGRGREADAALAAIDTARLTDCERARLAFLRASNLLWALGDPTGAKQVIDDVAVLEPGCRGYIDAFLTVYWFAMDQPDAALQAASDLELEHMPPVVGAELAWVLTTIDAESGRTDAAVKKAEAGYFAATRSLDAPHMRFNIADSHVSALWLAGRLDDAVDVAEQVLAQAMTLPGTAQLLGPAVAGRAALGAGDLRHACASLEASVNALCANHSLGWGHRYLIPQVMALAMCGRTDEAVSALTTLDGMKRPFRSLDHEHSLARAWVVACQGAVSEAIDILHEAAERSSTVGRFAAEVLCLQTAVQFGDRTRSDRLRELEVLVEGPRVGLASRFAAALRDDDAAELAALSVEFEGAGDIVAAIDAAAQAALSHRRRNRRGSALTCSTRAQALAQQCGADTPALRLASEDLPLTEREYEIVMLIGEGLQNRAVAERLTLSVRTVESHIYRAMSKTGTTTREELAALLSRRTRKPPR